MRKTAFVIVFMALFLISNTLYAEVDPEYAAGLKNYNSKKYEKAIEHFQAYIKKKPDPAGYYLIGYSLYKLKKFDEAENYFREAFLIDPEFSLEKAGLIKPQEAKPEEAKPEEVKKPAEKSPFTPPAKTEAPQKPAETKPVPAPKPEPQKAAPEKPKEAPKAPAGKQPAAPAPQKVAPPAVPAAPTAPMEFPGPKVSPGALTAIAAGFGLVFFGIIIAFYVYFSLCLYLIAKKLGVSAPWTAWIPVVNLWTFVSAAGKPGWWIILMFIPLVGAIISIYLWMCITENLGRNKWLGLLILVPLVGIVWMGILAFSKSSSSSSSGTPGSHTEETTQIIEQ